MASTSKWPLTDCSEQPPATPPCRETRRLGKSLFVCLEKKNCPYALPYGYLTFCKHPSVASQAQPT